MMEQAIDYTLHSDVFMVVGTSLTVYPAAGLINYAPPNAKKFLIDPNAAEIGQISNLVTIKKPATTAINDVIRLLNGIQ